MSDQVDRSPKAKDINGTEIKLGQKVAFARGGYGYRSSLDTGIVLEIFWSWRAKRVFVSIGIENDNSYAIGGPTKNYYSRFCVRRPESKLLVLP